MANAYTTNLNLTKPEVGGDNNSWGSHINSDLDTLDGIFKSDGTGTSVGLNVGSGKTLAVGGTLNVSGAATLPTLTNQTLASPTLSGTVTLPGSGNSIDSSGNITAPAFYGSGASLTGIQPFPAGTVMLFAQTSAPTGWTKSTTHNDKALRVVSGTASSGGTNSFSTVMAQTAVAATTLTTNQIPSHTHGITDPGHSHNYVRSTGSQNTGGDTTTGYCRPTSGDYTQATSSGTTGITVQNSGGGQSHTHGLTMDIQYVDVIFASKN
jgi:hypothetical protein